MIQWRNRQDIKKKRYVKAKRIQWLGHVERMCDQGVERKTI